MKDAEKVKERDFANYWNKIERNHLKPFGPSELPTSYDELKELLEFAFHEGFESGVEWSSDRR